MAEGWTRYLKGDLIEPFSAGINPHGMNPEVIMVMREGGVDISGQRSKKLDDFINIHFDYVVTVCSQAQADCPVFPGHAKIVHYGFDDPPVLAKGARTREEALNHYRRVRDEIKAFVETLPDALLTA